MTTIIYYYAGAYGTFIEWLLTYLTDSTLNDNLPFQYKGNSHNFKGNFLPPSWDHARVILNKNPNFSRTHPEYYPVHKLLSENYKIVNVYWSKQSSFWIWNNRELKVSVDQMSPAEVYYSKKYQRDDYELLKKKNEEKFRHFLPTEESQDTLKGYGVTDSADLVKWQLREILSYWNFEDYGPDFFSPAGPIEKSGVYNISLENLKDNFKETVLSLIEQLGFTAIQERADRLEEIHQSWLEKQSEAFKDQEITNFIDNTIQGTDFTISRLNFWEEAWIQQKLRERGYEIECDSLDNFPLSTIEMHKLIYDNSTDTERT